MRDPYQILGVDRNATTEQIGKAYREKARRYHPDLAESDKKEESAKKFKEIAAAFEILSNPEKKTQYDHFGPGGGPFMGRKPFTSPFDDFLSNFFRGAGPQRVSGQHIVVEHNVTLEEVYTGARHEIKYMRRPLCDKCKGVGGQMVTCSTCNGSGARMIYGPALTIKAPCQVCGGSGRTLGEVCGECKEGFKEPEERMVKFDVLRGIESGMRFCYQGMGEFAPEGVSGHLYVVINVLSHDLFERLDGGNIVCKVPVSYTQLILGDEILVPSISGKKVSVKIPSGTQSGSKFKLDGMGLPIFNGGNSIYKFKDEIVQVELEVPHRLKGRYKELIEELAKLERQNATPKKKIFAEKAGVP